MKELTKKKKNKTRVISSWHLEAQKQSGFVFFLKLGRSLTPDKSTGEFSFSRFIKVLYKCQHPLLE